LLSVLHVAALEALPVDTTSGKKTGSNDRGPRKILACSAFL
jgi:hypothetical protein